MTVEWRRKDRVMKLQVLQIYCLKKNEALGVRVSRDSGVCHTYGVIESRCSMEQALHVFRIL